MRRQEGESRRETGEDEGKGEEGIWMVSRDKRAARWIASCNAQ